MNKTMSMGLNQCLTKYPCSGHVKQKSLTLKIENQRVRVFSCPKVPLPCQPRVNGNLGFTP